MENINYLLLHIADQVNQLNYCYSILMDDNTDIMIKYMTSLYIMVPLQALAAYIIMALMLCFTLCHVSMLIFNFVRRCMQLRHIKIE
jgi:hypothetical protein